MDIANQLIKDIVDGNLKPDTKLPPQRELADYLDINLSTITKAYKHCELNGYIYGLVGKGTYVSPNVMTKMTLFDNASREYANLGLVEPFYKYDYYSLKIAKEVLQQGNALELFQYTNPIGSKSQIESALRWLKKFNVKTSKEQICILPGVQNALTVTLISLFKPGDRIAVDTFTYANFIKVSNLLNIRLVPIENDDNGMLPEKLENASNLHKIQGVFLMPTYSNPTNIVMSLERKTALASIIQKQNLLLIEDETYSFLNKKTITPFVNIIPKNTIYMYGVSKALSAGLRVAFIVFPKHLHGEFSDFAISMNLKCCSINAEIVTRMIDTKVADSMVKKKRKKSAEYNQVFQTYFPNSPVNLSFFQWIELPKGVRSRDFEEFTRKRHIKVLASHHFVVGAYPDKEYIRIALSSANSKSDLEKTLKQLSILMMKK